MASCRATSQALAAGQGQYWSYNSPKGRMLANGVLWRPASGAPGRVMMLLASDLADSIRRRLSMFVLRAKVVDRRSAGTATRCSALRAPAAPAPRATRSE